MAADKEGEEERSHKRNPPAKEGLPEGRRGAPDQVVDAHDSECRQRRKQHGAHDPYPVSRPYHEERGIGAAEQEKEHEREQKRTERPPEPICYGWPPSVGLRLVFSHGPMLGPSATTRKPSGGLSSAVKRVTSYPRMAFTCAFARTGGAVACSFLTLASSLMAAK